MNIQLFGRLLSEVFVSATSDNTARSGRIGSSVNLLQIIYSVYISGAVILLLKLAADLLNLFVLIARKKDRGSRIIKFNGFNTSGFSAMGYIFINTRLNPEESDEIIKHEQNHLRQNHFIDIIFIETIKAFQWFNPAVYLFNISLRAIHEYQADQGCLMSGIPVVNYQSLLLSQVFKSGTFNLTNSFSNPSLIKQRMIMMTKKPTSSFANMKLLLVVPVTGVVFLAISAYKEIPEPSQLRPDPIPVSITASSVNLPEPAKAASEGSKPTENKVVKSNEKTPPLTPPPPPPPLQISGSVTEEKSAINTETAEDITPFVAVEEMPLFPGGDAELLKFIAENTAYPEMAKTNNIQGRVIVRFCVTEKGAVNRISILKGVDPELDAEALRVVNTLPTFKPGRQGGKEVPVWYMVPITFTLR
jgi:TonB family protein